VAPMTFQEHRQRHIELHRALDELYADFLSHNLRPGHSANFFPVTMDRLMEWSYRQTQSPDELPHD
jgi:hypothetical protein